MSLAYTIVGANKRKELKFMSSCSNSQTLVATPKYLNTQLGAHMVADTLENM
jgi:hypothetical protein